MNNELEEYVAERLHELAKERMGDGGKILPSIQVIEDNGRVDFIDENDREVGEDRSGSGSEWFSDDITLINIFPEEDESESLEENTAYHLVNLGVTETDSCPDFYDPDGSTVSNYHTGEECRRSARLFGFTLEQENAICQLVHA